MNRKSLQALISAGVFSAALLNGVAYAADKKAATDKVEVEVSSETATTKDVPATTKDAKKAKTSTKDGASSGCAGSGGCGGK